jgi:hypothetical protein
MRPVCSNEPSGHTLPCIGNDAIEPVVSMGVHIPAPPRRFLLRKFRKERALRDALRTLRDFLDLRALRKDAFFPLRDLRDFLDLRDLRDFLDLRDAFFALRAPPRLRSERRVRREERRARLGRPPIWLSVLNNGADGSTPPGQFVYAFWLDRDGWGAGIGTYPGPEHFILPDISESSTKRNEFSYH